MFILYLYLISVVGYAFLLRLLIGRLVELNEKNYNSLTMFVIILGIACLPVFRLMILIGAANKINEFSSKD